MIENELNPTRERQGASRRFVALGYRRLARILHTLAGIHRFFSVCDHKQLSAATLRVRVRKAPLPPVRCCDGWSCVSWMW